jgi:predicted GIY-YIG superfamily endonuclease
VKVADLIPQPRNQDAFRRNRERFIVKKPGCYVLATFDGTVLYIGLSNDLRRRFVEHLQCREKTSLTERGRAVLFHWMESEQLNSIERAWMNMHTLHEGELPVLNKVFSPVSI